MKLNQLPIGARFQWKDQTYTKVGPMTARSDTGQVDFIPKYAALLPAPGEAPPPPPPEAPPQPLDAARVEAAFEAYHQHVLAVVDSVHQPALEAARQSFLDAIR
ncbi:MAG: hypothetical protein ACK4KV_18100 [Rhodocyclaceae bacterium]